MSEDGRWVIAVACLIYSACLALAVTTYGHIHVAATGLLLASAGACGPLQTGGISSRLPTIVASDQRSQRKAQGWDVATYGIGGTIGPSMVAGLAAWATPKAAALSLALASSLAAIAIFRLPRSAPAHGGNPSSVPGAWQTIAMMLGYGPLRRTLYMTMLVAFSMAALPIAAVHMAPLLGAKAASAAVLTAAYGLGNLAGSLVLMQRRLKGEPDPLVTSIATVVIGGLTFITLSQSLALATVAYVAAGAINAAFFAATLAARSEYAPPRARGQTFLWVAAMKITASSAGTAAAGFLTAHGSRFPLYSSICITILCVLAPILDRRLSPAM